MMLHCRCHWLAILFDEIGEFGEQVQFFQNGIQVFWLVRLNRLVLGFVYFFWKKGQIKLGFAHSLL